MKKKIILMQLILLILIVGCQDKTIRVYKGNSPITISYDHWRSIKPELKESNKLENPGKIYIYKNALYINERGLGIHIYNNSDPSNPIDEGFIPIHSNFDVAVKGNTLYAQSYSDLLIFDVSDPLKPIYINRELNVFSLNYDCVKEGYDENYPTKYVDMNKEVVLGWELKTIEEEVENSNRDDFSILNNSSFAVSEDMASYSGESGRGGSMASFTIMNNTLYVLDQTTLKYSPLDNETDLPEFEDISLSRDAETLFPYASNLFIGTTTGMLIYDIANDGTPTYLSAFEHWTGCDPVVVSDDKAYVTLSSGCGLPRNELHVVDVSDLSRPELIKSYNFDHPLGLGVVDSTLFLCDDYAGLKVFNITNSETIKDNMIKHYNGINAYDVIPWNNLLIMVGSDGILQYNYADLENIVQLSHLKVQ
ncbi:MAG: hypothetical protein CMD18_01380 [Flavobacteriales bacterium]|nr:hypothetical protein [Flavobacteriales bacterium]